MLICYFSNCFSFYSVFTGCFNQHDYSFDDVKEIGWSFVKFYPIDRKVFQNKCYDVIIFVRNNAGYVLSRESNYLVYVVMCLNFDNSNIKTLTLP